MAAGIFIVGAAVAAGGSGLAIRKAIRRRDERIGQIAYDHGYDVGYDDGKAAGREEGQKEGFESGKTTWVLEDRRQPVSGTALNDTVYGPKRIAIPPGAVEAMRNLVETLVGRGLVVEPTKQQWNMIFADHPATCVTAGAGSGKSTTLVLRLLFMAQYLRIKLDDITVVTFTRAAAADLREKIVRVFNAAGRSDMNESRAETVVRTFHSVLYGMAGAAFPGARFFEMLGKGNHGSDVENPLSSARLTDDQLDELRETYIDLYSTEQVFRRHVNEMLRLECERDAALPEADDKHDWLVEAAANRDKRLIEIVNERWEQHGLWPIPGVEPGPLPAFRTRTGHQYFANGRVTATGKLVFLGNLDSKAGRDMFDRSDVVEDGSENPQTVGTCLGVKRNIYSCYCDRPAVIVTTEGMLARLRYDVALQAGLVTSEAPLFDVHLTGDLDYQSLHEAFWSHGSFVESLGLEVPEACGRLVYRDESLERHFTAALGIFWKHFEKRLFEAGLITFNRAFLTLAKPGKHVAKLDRYLAPLTHLLVDEFQDISPQIVDWLVGCQRRLAELDRKPTIMAIGDDWQSIYGWRGSAPDFFINFERHFRTDPALGAAPKCEMTQNHRSVSGIVNGSAAMLDRIVNRVRKTVQATRQSASAKEAIHFYDEQDIAENLNEHLAFILEKRAEALAIDSKEKNKVIVLSRSRSLRDKLRKQLPKDEGILCHTFHGAKGLQGEIAVIFDDAEYDGTHILRNKVYGLKRDVFAQTYDEAQIDEAYRLAYVALTRGVSQSHWFVREARHAARAYKEANGL